MNEKIINAYTDAAETIPFGPAADVEITDRELFHLAPIVCIKFRGIERTTKNFKIVTVAAMSSYVANDHVHGDTLEHSIMAFALCYVVMQLQTKKDDSLYAEIQHLQSIYKPSKRKYASVGLAIILSGALGVMTQMEKVSGILEKYSPFGKQYISTGLFVCLLCFLTTMFRKLWEGEYIKRKSEEFCSPKCANDFMEYLKVTRSSDAPILEFSEVEVFDFISGGRQRLKGVVSFLGFQIFRRETVNRLKDIFIHNSLNKKLVDVSRADGMQRFFMISSTRASHLWYHAYMVEQAKIQASLSAKASE